MLQQPKSGFILRVIVRIATAFSETTNGCLGLSAGSELVTAKFELDFLERFRQTKLRGTTKALYRARKEFDFIKMGVGEDDEPEFWDCPVEGLLREEGTDFQDGYMRFTR